MTTVSAQLITDTLQSFGIAFLAITILRMNR